MIIARKSRILAYLLRASPVIYKSYIITLLIQKTNRLLDIVFYAIRSTTLSRLAHKVSWKYILLFLFVFTLPITPDSQIELSTFTSSNLDVEVANQRQFGIVLFSFANIFLLLLLFVLVRQYRKLKDSFFAFTSYEMLLFLFLLIAGITSIMSVNIIASFVWNLKVLYCFAIYVIFSRLSLYRKELKIIFYACIASIFLQAGVAFAQFLQGGLIGIPIESGGRLDFYRVVYLLNGIPYFKTVGTLSHPSNLSAYIGLLMPFALILKFTNIPHARILSMITLVFGIAITFLTLSRWGLITNIFACVFVYFLIMKFSKISAHKIFSYARIDILVILIVALLFLQNPPFFERFLQFSPNDGSLRTRVDLLSQAFYTITNSPQGIGGGAFPGYTADYDVTESQVSQRYFFQVHNFYLLLAAEIGVLGLIVFVVFMIRVLSQSFRRLQGLSLEDRLTAMALIASVTTFLFNGLWEPRSFGERLGFLFFFLLGVLMNIILRKRILASKINSYQ